MASHLVQVVVLRLFNSAVAIPDFVGELLAWGLSNPSIRAPIGPCFISRSESPVRKEYLPVECEKWYDGTMDTTTTRNVMDIRESERQALEHLLGAPLEPQQRVMIFSYTPGTLPPDNAREAACSQIEQMMKANQQLAVDHGTSSEESDSAIDEAMKKVRQRP